MLSVVENFKNGKLELADVPAPICRPGCVLVANRASLISAGTERAVISLAKKSLAGKALKRPDLVRQVIDKVRRDGLMATIKTVRSKLDSPIALGYSSAGVVLETASGVNNASPGDRVACAGAGWATHSEVVSVPKNLCVRIPDAVSFEDASYVTLGAIAMHGVRQARPALGERVAVIGCGLLGLLTTGILAAAGARVFAIDINESRLELAATLGASGTASTGAGDVAALAEGFTEGVGFDAVLITAATKSSDPLHLAARIARDRARIVVVGDVGMHVRRRPLYEKELTIVMSRSYGPGRYDPVYEERGIEYPLGYVRWGEKRNLAEFLNLIADGKVNVAALTTHTFPIRDALSAYDIVLGKRPEPHIGIVLGYDEEPSLDRLVELSQRSEPGGRSAIGVGFVGAGAFARSVLLPALSACEGAEPVAISSAGGLSAEDAGRKFGFRYAVTDFQKILDDDSVNAVIIATRHNLHATQVTAALAAGKDVYVEKPLALTRDELEDVRRAYVEAGRMLMVGFNRRFSPHALAAKELFAGLKRPLVINYRVNAGVVARDSWIQDPAEGGGRILGEVCHFIDLATFFCGTLPRRVFAARAGGGALDEDADNVVVTLVFGDGSVGVITYVASGETSFSKERVEIAGGGKTAVIEDFRRTYLYSSSRRRTVKTAQDKGHGAEMAAFFEGLTVGRAPIRFDELYAVTLGALAVEESLAKAAPVVLSELA